jgi:Domain of unknown function (DUF1839)
VSAVTGRATRSLSGKAPAGYECHPLHSAQRDYPETNCYADVLIELLHACGYEPLAAFGHLARMDFEGDQWTFFKPPPHDLERLYAVDIHEMQPYRPLPAQIDMQLAHGRTMVIELDSFYLPDTASTTYGNAHVKTSVAADAIDREGERLHYFHGGGLYQLTGDDYRGIFAAAQGAALPPYAELVRFDAGEALRGEALREVASVILREHLQLRPVSNPFDRFGAALSQELASLLEGSLEEFHAYAFATVRMAGSAFEVAAAHSQWLFGERARGVVDAMREIVEGCKALSFRLARRRPFDLAPRTHALADAWERSMGGLVECAG